VNVQNINGNGEFRQLDILSLDGKIVKSVAVNFTQGNHSVMIPVADLPKGVFLFKFTGESGVLATRRLIHQ
jgi:hypothetical protein